MYSINLDIISEIGVEDFVASKFLVWLAIEMKNVPLKSVFSVLEGVLICVPPPLFFSSYFLPQRRMSQKTVCRVGFFFILNISVPYLFRNGHWNHYFIMYDK